MSQIGTLEVRAEGEVIVASLAGEIDPSNAREMNRELTEAVPNNALAVVLDLAAVDYLDSSGVQLIFELAERLTGRQQRLAIAVPEDAPARRVLDIVALDQTAPMAPTVEEARAQLGL